MPSRVAFSLLENIDVDRLHDTHEPMASLLTVSSLKEMHDTALRISRDPLILQKLKNNLKRKSILSPIFDHVQISEDLALAYKASLELNSLQLKRWNLIVCRGSSELLKGDETSAICNLIKC